HEQEKVGGDRLERRVERGRDQEEGGHEGDEAPGWRWIAARRAPVEPGSCDREHEEERLEAEGCRVHVGDAARRPARARLQRGRRISATQIPSVTSCSTIITIPESC